MIAEQLRCTDESGEKWSITTLSYRPSEDLCVKFLKLFSICLQKTTLQVVCSLLGGYENCIEMRFQTEGPELEAVELLIL